LKYEEEVAQKQITSQLDSMIDDLVPQMLKENTISLVKVTQAVSNLSEEKRKNLAAFHYQNLEEAIGRAGHKFLSLYSLEDVLNSAQLQFELIALHEQIFFERNEAKAFEKQYDDVYSLQRRRD